MTKRTFDLMQETHNLVVEPTLFISYLYKTNDFDTIYMRNIAVPPETTEEFLHFYKKHGFHLITIYNGSYNVDNDNESHDIINMVEQIFENEAFRLSELNFKIDLEDIFGTLGIFQYWDDIKPMVPMKQIMTIIFEECTAAPLAPHPPY